MQTEVDIEGNGGDGDVNSIQKQTENPALALDKARNVIILLEWSDP